MASQSPLTRHVLLLEAVNGGPLGFGLEQEQEHGFEDAGHVAERERPHQPALGRRADGAVSAGQAVQHDEQGPVCGTAPPVSVRGVCPRPSALGPQTQAGEDARGATSFHATVSRRAFNPNARASATSVKRDREGGPRASRAGIRGCVSGPTPRILEMRQRDFLKQCGL